MDQLPPTVLRQYKSVEHQSFRKHWCGESSLERYALPVSSTTLVPFMVYRTSRIDAITSVLLKDIEGNTLADISANFDFTAFTMPNSKQALVAAPENLDISEFAGQFAYLEISDEVETYYFEVMQIFNLYDLQPDENKSKCGFIRLFLETTCRVGKLPIGFQQLIYIRGNIGQPEYDIQLLTEPDGDEHENRLFGRVEKVYKLSFVATEPIADALALLPLLSGTSLGVVTFLDQWNNGGASGIVNNVDFDQEWLNGGCFAKIDLAFRIETITAKPCCDDERATDEACLVKDFEATAQLTDGSAEFTGGYHTELAGNIPFAVNEYAVIKNGTVFTLRKWNGSGWDTVTAGSILDNVYVIRENKWLFKGTAQWYDKPIITSFAEVGGTRTFKGESFRGSSVKLIGLIGAVECNFVQIGTTVSAQYFYSTGVPTTDEVYSVYPNAFTAICEFGDGGQVLNEGSPC